MPSKKREGMTPLYIEIPDDLAAELDEFVRRYPLGGKADHIRLAIRRHMDAPPEVVIPPLSKIDPLPEAEPEPKRGRGRPRKEK